ncbi:DJ-1/PfpI family protein, partial [Candidatus Sumerlaeota bacterium]|nr:DJ-1/PfpI family protein [Candidatus Sumerlaeota bacterium]
DKEVVVDGNLVTSRAWPDHPAFMREFLKLLK